MKSIESALEKVVKIATEAGNTRLLHALCEYQEALNAELTAELNGEKLFVFKANGRTVVMNMAVMKNCAETGCPTGLPDDEDFQKAMGGAMTTTINISDLIIGGGSCMN